MNKSKNEWIIPKKVFTPNIEEDIKNLLSEKVLQKYLSFGEAEHEKRQKIIRITEMLDLCDHLSHLKKYLSSINEPEIRGNCINDHILFEKHDYSGCPYDLEALIFYLYVSIIDACAMKGAFITIYDFLKEEIKEDVLKDEGKDYILTLCEKHDEMYGLSKNFKGVFFNISDELKDEFTENIMVLKNRKTPYKIDEVNTKYEEWIGKNRDERIKKIADMIYSLRCKYSHENIRAFIPSVYWEPIPPFDSITCNCIAKKNTDLFFLLKKVIIECCEKM